MTRKAGRKRKPGKREPNGQPQRQSQMHHMGVVLARRCRAMGWPPSDENLRRARDPQLDTLPGRLFVAGLIGANAYKGIMAYNDLRIAYQRAIECPGGHQASAMGGMPARGSIADMLNEEDHAAWVRRVTDRHMAAIGAAQSVRGDWAIEVLFSAGGLLRPEEVRAETVDLAKRAGLLVANALGIFTVDGAQDAA